MRKCVTWLWLLIKRQYKKPAFLCLLLLIPILVFGYTALNQGQSGAVTVVLAYETEDVLAQRICDKLQNESMLIRFITADKKQAENMVLSGKADAAWIFPVNTKEALLDFLSGSNQPFVRVLEREQSVSLLLTREKLAAAVFTVGAELHFDSYLRENVPALKDVPADELMAYYNSIMMDGELFRFEDITGAEEQLVDQKSYLLSPLRGILGVLAAVCALAAAMDYCGDVKKGVFSRVKENNRVLIELTSQMICQVSVLTVSAVCLSFAGLTETFFVELASVLSYGFCCAGFGMLLRIFLRKGKWIATILPVVSVGMLAVCPVFFHLDALRHVQLLLPATFYINGAYSAFYLLGGAVYGCACLILYFLIKAIKKGVP